MNTEYRDHLLTDVSEAVKHIWDDQKIIGSVVVHDITVVLRPEWQETAPIAPCPECKTDWWWWASSRSRVPSAI